MQYRSVLTQKPSKTLLIAASLLILSSACRETTTQPVVYRIDVPAPGQVQVQIELTQRIGLGLAGSFDIDIEGTRYGRIFLEPETRDHGFKFGFDLNLAVFVPEAIGSFEKTSRLPTGQDFSTWVQSPMVELTIPEANIPELSWNFYLGTEGRVAVGAAATISAINGSFPSLSLEYVFRDKQGRMILGVQFYGPGRDTSGAAVPGGIFIGTDLTELLPAEALAYLPAAASRQAAPPNGSSGVQIASVKMALKQDKAASKPQHASGKSAFRESMLRGRDARQYRHSPDRLRDIVGRMLEYSHH